MIWRWGGVVYFMNWLGGPSCVFRFFGVFLASKGLTFSELIHLVVVIFISAVFLRDSCGVCVCVGGGLCVCQAFVACMP